jgi:hypothetical protein
MGARLVITLISGEQPNENFTFVLSRARVPSNPFSIYVRCVNSRKSERIDTHHSSPLLAKRGACRGIEGAISNLLCLHLG